MYIHFQGIAQFVFASLRPKFPHATDLVVVRSVCMNAGLGLLDGELDEYGDLYQWHQERARH